MSPSSWGLMPYRIVSPEMSAPAAKRSGTAARSGTVSQYARDVPRQRPRGLPEPAVLSQRGEQVGVLPKRRPRERTARRPPARMPIRGAAEVHERPRALRPSKGRRELADAPAHLSRSGRCRRATWPARPQTPRRRRVGRRCRDHGARRGRRSSPPRRRPRGGRPRSGRARAYGTRNVPRDGRGARTLPRPPRAGRRRAPRS